MLHKLKPYWLSFVNENVQSEDKFVGACIVIAPTNKAAKRFADSNNLTPLGVTNTICMPLPCPLSEINPDHINRLFKTMEEMEQVGLEPMRAAEFEEKYSVSITHKHY